MNVSILDKWHELLGVLDESKRDVYFTEEYVKLYENEAEKARCLCCRDGENIFLLPVLLREFHFAGDVYFDFETAYGYGGPIWNHADEAFKRAALRSMVEALAKQHYIAGFVRFHPLLQNQEGFEQIGRLLPERKTVAINLDQTMDEVWKNEIHSKNRNMIRRAEKAGLRFEADYGYAHIRDFIRLYDSTMDKLSAEEFYYFDDRYYENLVKGIPNSFLGCVYYGEQIISSAIFMYEGTYGHYHLSGSDKSQLSLSPNNFMLWEAARELKEKGVKRFHLGGGTNSDEENTLFLFKKRFSKDTCQFYIGKLIFNQEQYDAICQDWEQKNPDKAKHYKHHLLKYKY